MPVKVRGRLTVMSANIAARPQGLWHSLLDRDRSSEHLMQRWHFTPAPNDCSSLVSEATLPTAPCLLFTRTSTSYLGTNDINSYVGCSILIPRTLNLWSPSPIVLNREKWEVASWKLEPKEPADVCYSFLHAFPSSLVPQARDRRSHCPSARARAWGTLEL